MRRIACAAAMAVALCLPVQASSPARKAEAALVAALVPNGETGWRLPNRPRVVGEAGAGYTLRAEGASYSLGNGLAIEFDAIEAQVAPQPGGTLAVTLSLPAPLYLAAPEGVWATLTPGRHRISGVWDPAREAFRSLEVTFAAALALANGATIAIEQAGGRFTAEAGGLDGTLSLAGLATNGSRTADEVAVRFRQEPGGLAVSYRHALPGTTQPGIAGELVPLHLSASAKVAPFPHETVLGAMAPWLVEVASRTPDAGRTWSALWRHLTRALGAANAQMIVEKLDARSFALTASGAGSVEFGAGGPRGTIDATLGGINERIARLTPAERKASPLLFPSLALMTVVGDGANENGRRLHRYRVELVEGGVKVNGRDAAGLKP